MTAVVAQGRGPLMVLAPSFGRDSEDFGAVAAGLAAAGMRVLRPQPRGVGGTGELTGLTYADWAGDLLAAVAAERGGPAILLGHAAGSRYVRAAAAIAPAAVRGVVLAAAARPGPPAPEQAADLARCVAAETTPAECRAALRRSFFAPGNDVDAWLTGWHPATARAQRASAPSDGWERAGGVPVLDLIGAQDPWRPPATREAVAAALGPRVSVAVVDGASHALLPERPDAVVTAVARWAATLSPH
ncbi:alpha/beta hydrolase [Actinoplanes sp. NPDC026619]|uniref:alpha/beta fold hydrolase n=1 Tax=Actinoplanes sp. NPDC026619 TaxID=3155798 RepID=UPI00340F9C9B